MDIQNKKVDIQSLMAKRGIEFSSKTMIHIQILFEKFGYDTIFGRSAVMNLLELKASGTSKLLSKLVQTSVIEAVSGYGKGKYRFKRWV